MTIPKPREIFQAELDALVERYVGEARPECRDTIRHRLTAPGRINDALCDEAMARMRDRFADMADEARQRAKDARL